MTTTLIFSVLSWLFTVVFCSVYLRSILSWETKPHIYTALFYAIMTWVIFSSQVSQNAGLGATYLGIIFVFWCLIFCMSFRYGIKDIILADKISLLLACISIPIWYFSWDPLLAVILLMFVDLFSTIPTIRKTYVDPYSENTYVYLIEFVWILFSIFALTQINFINAW